MPSPPDPDRPTEADLAAELSDAIAAVRSVQPTDGDLEPPPPALWDRIAGALAEEGVAPGPPAASASDPAPAPDVGALVADLDAARRRRAVPLGLALAAAAVLVVVLGVVAIVATFGGADDTEVRAAATLATLDTEEPVGSADLVDDAGQLELVVDFPDQPADGGYFELWLINEDVTGLVSLGPVEPGRTTVRLPDAVDPADFPIVDVSIEPPDGDPAHSGDSVVRGQLQPV